MSFQYLLDLDVWPVPARQADYLIRFYEEAAKPPLDAGEWFPIDKHGRIVEKSALEGAKADAARIRRWKERLSEPAVRQAIALAYRTVRSGGLP